MTDARGANPDSAPAPPHDVAPEVVRTVGVLGFDTSPGPVVLALDALDDALRQLDQGLRRELGVNNIDVLALQYIDRRQRRGTTTRARDLAPRLGVTSGAATSIVQRLERAQLVESADDPTDGRGRTIVLAVRAHELAGGLLAPIREDLSNLIGELDQDQQRELVALLDRVHEILLRTSQDVDARGDGQGRLPEDRSIADAPVER